MDYDRQTRPSVWNSKMKYLEPALHSNNITACEEMIDHTITFFKQGVTVGENMNIFPIVINLIFHVRMNRLTYEISAKL